MMCLVMSQPIWPGLFMVTVLVKKPKSDDTSPSCTSACGSHDFILSKCCCTTVIGKDFWFCTPRALQKNSDLATPPSTGLAYIQQPSWLSISARGCKGKTLVSEGLVVLAAVDMFFLFFSWWPAQSVVSLIAWRWIGVCISSLCLRGVCAGALTSPCSPETCTLCVDSDWEGFVHPSLS